MKKCILWSLFLMAVTTWGYAQETKSMTVQPTAATAPNASMTAQPTTAVPTAQPTVAAASAPSTASANPSASPWYLSVAGGIDVPAQNWIPAYSLGGGGNVVVGYRLSEDWAVELDLDNFIFSNSSTLTGAVSDYESRILPTVRYTFSTGSDIQPYVLAGSGIDVQFLNSPLGGTVVTSFDIAVGLGVEWEMDSNLYLFAEGKWNFLMADGQNNSIVTGQDIPVLAGVRLGL